MDNKLKLFTFLICLTMLSSCASISDGNAKLSLKIINNSGMDLRIYKTPDIHTVEWEFVESIPAGFNGVLESTFEYRSGTFLEARSYVELLYASIWFLVDDDREIFEWTIN